MKHLFAFLAAFALVLAVLAPEASAQVTPNQSDTLSVAASVTVTNGTTLTIASNSIPVVSGRGMAFLTSYTGAGAATDNLTFSFNVSHDGTTWTTSKPITATQALNGTSPVVGYFLIPPTTLDHVNYLRLASVGNAATNNCSLTSVRWMVKP